MVSLARPARQGVDVTSLASLAVMQPFAAGSFAAWVHDMQRALRGEIASDVPCEGCTACCTSGMFVPIGPDELDALAHVPAELVFPAPRRPGYVVIPHDGHGRC